MTLWLFRCKGTHTHSYHCCWLSSLGNLFQAGDKHYHPTCARCSRCDKLFTEGDEMYVQGQSETLLPVWGETRAWKCAGTLTTIIAAGNCPCLDIGSTVWHPQCRVSGGSSRTEDGDRVGSLSWLVCVWERQIAAEREMLFCFSASQLCHLNLVSSNFNVIISSYSGGQTKNSLSWFLLPSSRPKGQ